MKKLRELLFEYLYRRRKRVLRYKYGLLFSIACTLMFGSIESIKEKYPRKYPPENVLKKYLHTMYYRDQYSFFIFSKLKRKDILNTSLTLNEKKIFYQQLRDILDLGNNEQEALKMLKLQVFISPHFRYVISNTLNQINNTHMSFYDVISEYSEAFGEGYVRFLVATQTSGKSLEVIDNIITDIMFKEDLNIVMSKSIVNLKINAIMSFVFFYGSFAYIHSIMIEPFIDTAGGLDGVVKVLYDLSVVMKKPYIIVLTIVTLLIFTVVIPKFSSGRLTDFLKLHIKKLEEIYLYLYNATFFINIEFCAKYLSRTEKSDIKEAIEASENTIYREMLSRKLKESSSENIISNFFTGINFFEPDVQFRLKSGDGVNYVKVIAEAKEYYNKRKPKMLKSIPETIDNLSLILVVSSTMITTGASLFINLFLADLTSM